MIGKIHSPLWGERALFPSQPVQNVPVGDFHSFLQGRITEMPPLEWAALEFLKKALESAMSETRTETAGLSEKLSPFLPCQIPPPQNTFVPHPPREGEMNLEGSNYLPRKQDFEPLVREAGKKFGVDPSLIRAVIRAESGGNPLAVSRAGARGLMQLMPETATELGVTDSFNPTQNIMAGTGYLRRLLDRYRGDVKLALAAYNWGMGNLEKRPGAIPEETRNYIARVEEHYRDFTKA
jgi:hypothetical protein